jgi:hypothetical protein
MCCGVAVYAQLMEQVQHIAGVVSINAEPSQQVGLWFVGISKQT